MKKLVTRLLVIVFGLFLIGSLNLKADGPLVEAIDAASIRAKVNEEVEQGLRFYAKLNGEADEHGFYLVFGEATVQQLQIALSEQGESEFATLNEKDVFRVPVPGVTQEDEFSVVLTGIPGPGYLQNISVFPFAVVDEEETIVESVTRSVAEVAFKAAYAGEVNEDVFNTLEANFKRLGMNAFGELELTGNMFETNHFVLREEFIKDWNAKFGTSWTELVGSTFDAYAQVGHETGDLSGTRSYQFFNDPLYKDKWEFVLHIMELKGSGTTWPMVQAQALLGDGTVSGRPNLHVGRHLHFSIANFFNGNFEVYGYSGVNFSGRSIYNDVLSMINGVYINFSEYELYKLGDEFEFESATPKEGYNFAHYKVGQQTHLAGSQYEVTASNVLFELVYQPIQYNISYYDGEVKIDDLDDTYTIEDAVTLPNYNKEGFVFEGWYDNPELNGLPITSIVKGSTGNKVFYADTVASEASSSITYNLDGGDFYKYTSREEMVNEFLDDYTAFYNNANNASLDQVTLFHPTDGEGYDASTALIGRLDNAGANTQKIFANAEFYNKWIWIIEYTNTVKGGHADFTALINKTATAGSSTVKYELWAFLAGRQHSSWPASSDYSGDANKNGFWNLLEVDAPETYEHGYEITLLIPFKLGATFGGWYLEDDFSGTSITKISAESTGDVTLYAKWE